MPLSTICLFSVAAGNGAKPTFVYATVPRTSQKKPVAGFPPRNCNGPGR